MKKYVSAIVFVICTMCFFSGVLPAVAETSESFQGVSKNEIYYLKNVYSGKYMEVDGKISVSKIIQNEFTGSINQQFKISFSSQISAGKYYSIIPQINSDLKIDVVNAVSNNGTKIQAFKNNPSFSYAQQFMLVPNSDDTYRIIAQFSTPKEKAVEVAGPSIQNRAPVQLWDYVGAANQKWVLVPVENRLQAAAETNNIKYSSDRNFSLTSNVEKNITVTKGERIKLKAAFQNLTEKTYTIQHSGRIIYFDIHNISDNIASGESLLPYTESISPLQSIVKTYEFTADKSGTYEVLIYSSYNYVDLNGKVIEPEQTVYLDKQIIIVK